MAGDEPPWTPIDLKVPYLLGFRHKKRRPETSLDVYLVGRGNLNRVINVLILIEFGGFSFRLEYLLESESVIGKGWCLVMQQF